MVVLLIWRLAVAVVGAGGLGCAVLEYLTAAGVGRLTIVDHDTVEESNLHRQPLYRMSDLGRLKVDAACAALGALNPDVRLEARADRLTPAVLNVECQHRSSSPHPANKPPGPRRGAGRTPSV